MHVLHMERTFVLIILALSVSCATDDGGGDGQRKTRDCTYLE